MNDKPSSLALKLAACLFKKDQEQRALDIENVLTWHRHEERQRIYDANKLLPGFCENTSVFRNRNRGEFFELQLLPPEPDNPYEVVFKRYAVPGRYWVYSFYYTHEGSGRVVYGTETDGLAKSLKMIEADLNKTQVVELFERAFNAERIVCHYRHDTLQLLEMLAPKSKAYLKTHKLCEDTMKTREIRLKAARAVQIAAETKVV